MLKMEDKAYSLNEISVRFLGKRKKTLGQLNLIIDVLQLEHSSTLVFIVGEQLFLCKVRKAF